MTKLIEQSSWSRNADGRSTSVPLHREELTEALAAVFIRAPADWQWISIVLLEHQQLNMLRGELGRPDPSREARDHGRRVPPRTHVAQTNQRDSDLTGTGVYCLERPCD